jgi:hypothetical protein
MPRQEYNFYSWSFWFEIVAVFLSIVGGNENLFYFFKKIFKFLHLQLSLTLLYFRLFLIFKLASCFFVETKNLLELNKKRQKRLDMTGVEAINNNSNNEYMYDPDFNSNSQDEDV